MLQINKNFGNKKLQQIVEKGLELFWHHGYKRISIEEICKEAQVSKNTFYKHFSNKLDLIRFILIETSNKGMNDYEEIMAMEIPFEEKVRKLLDMKFKAVEDISENFFKDIYVSGDEDIIKLIHEMAQSRVEVIYRTFKRAQIDGDIRDDVNLEFIVHYMSKMGDMTNDETLVNMFETPADLIMELTNFFFYGIMSREIVKKNHE